MWTGTVVDLGTEKVTIQIVRDGDGMRAMWIQRGIDRAVRGRDWTEARQRAEALAREIHDQ